MKKTKEEKVQIIHTNITFELKKLKPHHRIQAYINELTLVNYKQTPRESEASTFLIKKLGDKQKLRRRESLLSNPIRFFDSDMPGKKIPLKTPAKFNLSS